MMNTNVIYSLLIHLSKFQSNILFTKILFWFKKIDKPIIINTKPMHPSFPTINLAKGYGAATGFQSCVLYWINIT